MFVSYKPFLRKKTVKALHGTVYIRITYQRQHIYANVFEMIPADKWDTKKGIVKASYPGAEMVNELIQKELFLLRQKITEQRLKGLCMDFDSIKNLLQNKESGLSLSALLDEYAANAGMKARRKYHMNTVVKHCNQYNLPKDITEITEKNILFLKSQLQAINKTNTVLSVIKRLKTLFNYAVKKGYLKKSPAEFIKLGEWEIKKEYLTEDELKLIISSLPLMEAEQKKAAQVFLFACYCGLRFGDLIALTQKNIEQTAHGKAILFTAQKTGKQILLPLNDLSEKLLPVVLTAEFTNQHYNRLLKEVAKIAGILKNVSSHLARHTFATLGTARGIRLEVMQEYLQHSSIKTTQGYAVLMDKTKWDEMAKWNK